MRSRRGKGIKRGIFLSLDWAHLVLSVPFNSIWLLKKKKRDILFHEYFHKELKQRRCGNSWVLHHFQKQRNCGVMWLRSLLHATSILRPHCGYGPQFKTMHECMRERRGGIECSQIHKKLTGDNVQVTKISRFQIN